MDILQVLEANFFRNTHGGLLLKLVDTKYNNTGLLIINPYLVKLTFLFVLIKAL